MNQALGRTESDVPVYVVERYVPGLSLDTVWAWQARLREAAEGSGPDRGVRYVGSTVVLVDESCFCRFDAPSLDAVAAANELADVPFARILPAVEIGPIRGGGRRR